MIHIFLSAYHITARRMRAKNELFWLNLVANLRNLINTFACGADWLTNCPKFNLIKAKKTNFSAVLGGTCPCPPPSPRLRYCRYPVTSERRETENDSKCSKKY